MRLPNVHEHIHPGYGPTPNYPPATVPLIPPPKRLEWPEPLSFSGCQGETNLGVPSNMSANEGLLDMHVVHFPLLPAHMFSVMFQ